MNKDKDQFPKPIPSIATIWGNTKAIPPIREILDEDKDNK